MGEEVAAEATGSVGPTETVAEAVVAQWIAEFVDRGPAELPDRALRVLAAGVARRRHPRRVA